jgi:hypothetical protein
MCLPGLGKAEGEDFHHQDSAACVQREKAANFSYGRDSLLMGSHLPTMHIEQVQRDLGAINLHDIADGLATPHRMSSRF